LDPEKKKISLTLKDEKDNPWMKFINTFQVGDITDVKVVKLMPFGAFAEVLPGVDGLIHISQLADRRIARPADVVSEGDVVRAKILAIDHERQKISLSVRAVLEEGENVFVDEVEVE
jgi:4-hydroxy-3-methylbut-2-enyl diphosphate reductase